jgi:hypothetical protein
MHRYRRVERAGEAIFWNGTNTKEVVDWVYRHGDKARYTPREDERGYLEAIKDESWPAFPGSISIITPRQLLRLRRNEYVFRDDTGDYSIMTKLQFDHEYEMGA